MDFKLQRDDSDWAVRHNARLFAEAAEAKKQRDAAREQARIEWENTPDSERVCIVCGLKLSAVDVARITENPTRQRRHDETCDTFKIDGGVIRGLVGLLKEVYGEDEIPLASLQRVIEAWENQRGVCAVSRIKLAFPVAGESQTPSFDGSLLSPMDKFALQRQYEKEQAERKRQGELHSPVLDQTEDGKLRLVSRTVQRWREGLSDDEFKELVRVLHDETKTLPVSKSSHATGSTRRADSYYR